jgi:putative transposase
MATSPHHIDPSTYLDDLLTQASPDLMRQMLQSFINQILSTQADQICGVDYATTSQARTNTRNGHRHRDLDTRVGTVDVAVPKLRSGSLFPDWLLERRSRAEPALSTVIATCYLKGVSTRRMNDLVASLGITNLSKSQVSDMAKDLDIMVEDFRHRPLDGGPYLYVSCDALTMKVREGGRVVKTSVLLACGVNVEGYRELLGMQVATAESVASWTGFFRDLKARGLDQVYLVTSDAHLGIPARHRRGTAECVAAALPDALRQEPLVDGPQDAVADTVGDVPHDLPATRCRRGVGPGPGGRQFLRAQVPERRQLPGGGP